MIAERALEVYANLFNTLNPFCVYLLIVKLCGFPLSIVIYLCLSWLIEWLFVVMLPLCFMQDAYVSYNVMTYGESWFCVYCCGVLG